MKPTHKATQDLITQMRESGHMILVLTPAELQGVDPKKLENRLQELAVEVIEDIKHPNRNRDE